MTVAVTERTPNGRILLLAGVLVAAFGGMGVRLAHLTIVQRPELSAKADRQHRKTLRMAASRGSILDRSGRTLALTVGAPSIYASPKYHQVPADVVPKLAEILDMSIPALERRVNKKAGFVWLKRHVTRDQARAIASLHLDGVDTIIEPRRRYPKGTLAAHVIGTAAGSELRGRYGVELRYDRWMRGRETVLQLERDGRGRTMLTQGFDHAREDFDDAPAPGAELELTIDAQLQAMVERELALGVEKSRASAGTAILLDPHSGAVLALANYPTYDPNRPGSAEPEMRRNRGVTDPVEPGSTLKAMTIAAAYNEGVVGLEDQIDCEKGAFRIGRRTIHDHHRYELLSLPEVMKFSSNIGTAKIAGMLGPERLSDYLRGFGFGSPTSIDLPYESAGILRPAARWADIDFANISFGQGIAVTPIQIAAAFGAIANGGVLYKPYVLERAVDSSGNVLFDWDPGEREAASHRVIRPETAYAVTDMLELVVSEGTGKNARIQGVRVAGKTGTAQKVDRETKRYGKERLASFIGFAPAEQPALVVVVMIDNPQGVKYGGVVAAPIFREITARALDHLGRRPRFEAPLPRPISPLPAVAATVSFVEPVEPSGIPSFRGLSLRRAIERARLAGLRIELLGTGFVTRQDPAAGTAFEQGGVVRVMLEPST
ncbi:MAG: penicillin-binding protein [Candidatus Binatia bacterium]|nr:penicillin-binding protein [Candidatus Binatia bacterium]